MILNHLWVKLLAVFGAGFAAGFINVMSGGGSSITLPLLILFGVGSATANGTNRVAILIQNFSAVSSFKQEKVAFFGESLKLALLTLPGAIIGAFAAVRITNKIFNIILILVSIFIVISMMLPKKRNTNNSEKVKMTPSVIIAMLLVGFYGGFIQVGVGFMIMFALESIAGLSLKITNVHKVFIVMVYTLPAMIIFALNGKIDIGYAIALSGGNAAGAWLSAKLAIRKGEKFIKYFLAVSVLIMCCMLLSRIF